MDIAALKADLVRDEAVRSVVYDDATGKPLKLGDTLAGTPTIGCGHNACKPLSMRAVETILEDDIADVMADLDRALPWWRDLSEKRQRALANMGFNIGIQRLLGFQQMLASLKAGNWSHAAEAALDSRWRTQVGQRAERIAALIREG